MLDRQIIGQRVYKVCNKADGHNCFAWGFETLKEAQEAAATLKHEHPDLSMFIKTKDYPTFAHTGHFAGDDKSGPCQCERCI